MKHISLIIPVAIVIFSLAACGNRSSGISEADLPEAGLPAELRKLMAGNRDTAMLSDFEDIIPYFLTPNLNADIDNRIAAIINQQEVLDIASLLYTARRTDIRTEHLEYYVAHAELAEEIYFLFDFLKYGYAGYQYFGGDNVFLPLRDSMLKRLTGMRDPLRVSAYLTNLLVPSFRSVIADNHFVIQERWMYTPNYFLFMNENFVIRKSENDFTIELNDSTYVILETITDDGQPIEAILPTLTPQGEVAWMFGRMMREGDFSARRIRVNLMNFETGETRFIPVSLHRADPFSTMSHPQLEAREVAGITILENRCNNNADIEAVEMFFQSGYSLRGKPVLILDLRAHRGGITRLANAWIRGYSGYEYVHQLSFHHFALLTLTSAGLAGVDPSTVQEIIIEYDLSLPEWFLPALHQHSLIKNENLVIVLMDNETGSTGEAFIGYLRQLENVIFVGTNTRGAFTFAGVVGTRLPKSGLDIRFGTSLFLRSDLSQFEGVGFMPDLWVTPGESLERVLRFVERYRLKLAHGDSFSAPQME